MNIILVLLGVFVSELFALEVQNKTKRGLIHETHYYGETTPFRPVPLYPDNLPSQTQQQQGLQNYYTPKYSPQVKPNFEPEPKVTSQQVLYEYQQTPHNTVSNVHVNQQFHTVPVTEASYPQPYIQQPQNQYVASETVANPVQHNTYVHHTPYIPPQTPYLPAKYVYVNNKVLYNPTNPQQVHSQQVQSHQIQSHSLHPQAIQPQPIHPLHRPQNIQQKLPIYPQQKLTPPPILSPVTFQNYNNVEKTTQKPTEAPKKEIKVVEEEEEDEEVDDAEEEDDESEDDESFDRYRFEDDDDDRVTRYRKEEDDEDDEDSERGSSSYRTQHKSRPKHTKYSSGYKFKEGYKTKSNSSKKPSRKSQKNPRKESYAYYTKGPNAKGKIESIEGKSSQNIPVTVQKVYREKWYITKNTENKEKI